MLYPEIFKPEGMSFGNRSPNLNLARNVVRGGSSHWKKQSVREVTCPVGGCEHLVYLLKEGSTLHIAPGKVSSFEGDLKQTQVTYDFIEDHHVIHISTISISIRYRSIEVEIPSKHPILLCIDVKIVEPVHKIIPFWALARAVYGR